MATFDDKLLGEKRHYYCSSSEDDEEEEKDQESRGVGGSRAKPPTFIPASDCDKMGASANTPNTGPKGVIADWRRFKQLERENREESAQEQADLAKRLALTCRTDADDEKALEQEKRLEEQLDEDFLAEYVERRMREMMQRENGAIREYGTVTVLASGADLLSAVDAPEDRAAFVVILVYEPDATTCCRRALDAVEWLARRHRRGAKFCRVRASAAGLSGKFRVAGVPCLLVYRSGELVSSFVRFTDALGEDFCQEDLEGYLIEHGVLRDLDLVPSIIGKNENSSDSD